MSTIIKAASHAPSAARAAGCGSLADRLKTAIGGSTEQPVQVDFVMGAQVRRGIVTVSGRGDVTYLLAPHSGQMYSSSQRLHGDLSKAVGKTHVWPYRDPAHMRKFAGPAAVTIEVRI